ALVLEASVQPDVGLDSARSAVGDVRVQTDLLVQWKHRPLERSTVGQRDVEQLGVLVRRAREAHREAIDPALAVRRIRARVRSIELVPDRDLRDPGLADVDAAVDAASTAERRLEECLDLGSRGVQDQAGKIDAVAPRAVEVAGKRITGSTERKLEGQPSV